MTDPALVRSRARALRLLRRPAVAAIVTVVVLLTALLWWFLLRPDVPSSFAIDDAAASVAPEPEPEPLPSHVRSSASAPATAPAPDVEGTWLVDPAAGREVDGTSAGFRIVEELARIGVTEAVGRTELVSGSLTITGRTISDVAVSVDMASLETDDSHRDSHVRSALATGEFPTATFALSEPIELDAIPAEDETISVVATGTMTIRGVTNVVQVAIDGRLVDGTLVVVGSLPVRFTDYAVEVPRSAAVISVADEGTIEFQLFLVRHSPRPLETP